MAPGGHPGETGRQIVQMIREFEKRSGSSLAGGVTTFPTLTVQAQFTTGVWTDITTYVRQGTITRPATRLQGPVVQYEAGTCSLTLKNTDGRFDPDNASGPYWGGTATRTATFTGDGHVQAAGGCDVDRHGRMLGRWRRRRDRPATSAGQTAAAAAAASMPRRPASR